MRQRPRRLRIHRERQIPARLVHDLVRGEAVVAEQVIRLVEPVLAQRRRRGHVSIGVSAIGRNALKCA